MRKSLLNCALIMLFSASLQSLTITDNAGLSLQVASNGTIFGVSLNNTTLSPAGIGGFYSRDPKNKTNIALTGTATTTGSSTQLKLTNTLQDSVNAVITQGTNYIEVTGELKDLTGTDRGLWLGFNLPINTTGFYWGQSLSLYPTISSTAPAYTTGNNLTPIPAVWKSTGGIAMAIPPTSPCVFEVGADAVGLRIQMAFGLSKETSKFPSKARFSFRIYTINGTWGYRDALAKYYDWYPDYYRIDKRAMTALGNYHDWINMNYIGDTYNTTRQIDPTMTDYQLYTKTSARIQNIPNADLLFTNQDFITAIDNATTIQHYEKTGLINSPLLKEGRAAIKNCVCTNPDGSYGLYEKTTLAIDFPHNCDPDLFAGKNDSTFGKMYLRKPVDLVKSKSSDGKPGKFVSIHWDRLGGWSNFLNYRKDHFPYCDYPLTFDQNGTPCIQTQFSNYELFDAYRLLEQQSGYFHEAAGMKEYSWSKMAYQPAGHQTTGMFFLAAVLAGGWQEGSLDPVALGGYDFERTLIGRKAYRISSGNMILHLDTPTVAMIKNALAKTTAYGFACPLQWQYFYPKTHANYDPIYSGYTIPEQKAIWDQYEAPSLAIRLAGWEPVTYATTSSNLVQLQRFGRGDSIYITAWGPTPPATVDIEIDSIGMGFKARPAFSEMVSNTPITVTKSAKGWMLKLSMEKDMTRVIRMVPAKSTAIEKNSSDLVKFEVYPNPCSKIINIKCENAIELNYSCRITNTLNQDLYTSKLQSDKTSIDISNFAGKGIYFVKIIDEKGTCQATKKLIVQ